jgi:hypothetical protein
MSAHVLLRRYDASDRLALSQSVSTSSSVISTSDLRAGIYLLKVRVGTKHKDLKLAARN